MKLNWAERWVVNNPLRVIMQRVEMAWMAKNAPKTESGRLLEVGAGRGAAARLILRTFRPGLLVTTDLDPAMLRRGHDYLAPSELSRSNLCAADCLALPFADQSMDAVFGFGIIHHVVDWRSAVIEVARVLKPSGIYYLEELYPSLYQNILTKRFLLHPTVDRFKSHDLASFLTRTGFRTMASREIRLIGIAAVLQKI
jgi:ubiquinone/menaquinone biosynthesis C-methylase UbiE